MSPREGWGRFEYVPPIPVPDGTDPVTAILGVTGASGAPYAERLLRALAAVDCEVGLVASRSGVEVLATELYKDPSLAREDVLERFVGGTSPQVTVYVKEFNSQRVTIEGAVSPDPMIAEIIGISLALSRVMSALLFGVQPNDGSVPTTSS